MKKILFALLSMLFFVSVNAYAQEQGEQKQPTPEEMAAKEADRLEYWQVFYVDSTLQHDYAAWQEEVKKLQAARVDNYDLYTITSDKWMEQIDKTYKKLFTPQQWAAYLKSGAAKQQKAREKRKAKMSGQAAAKTSSQKK